MEHLPIIVPPKVRFSISERFLKELRARIHSLLYSLEHDNGAYINTLRICDSIDFILKNPSFYKIS